MDVGESFCLGVAIALFQSRGLVGELTHALAVSPCASFQCKCHIPVCARRTCVCCILALEDFSCGAG